MKKILIIGASILQLPAIIKAKERGYYVIVVDYNPHAVGIPYADEFHCISTIDIDGITRLAEMVRPDGIMTLATDLPMRSLASATSKLGLPGISPDTAIMATDKGEMIKAFEANHVEHPWFYIADNITEFNRIAHKVKFPCVMKPTDNAGNRGVCYIANRDELFKQYSYSLDYSHSGHVIIEDYLEGDEVSVELIVYHGEVHILAVTDKLTMGKPYFVEIGHAEQSQKPAEVIASIHNIATKAVKAIGIDNSPAHVEIKITPNGPVMVELGSRMGGGCITSHLVPLSCGIDMINAVMDISMGIEPDLTPKFNRGSALRHLVGIEGVIQSIEGLEDARGIPGVYEVTMLKQPGELCTPFRNGSDRIGYVIASADTTAEAISICEKAISKINVNVK